MSQKHNACESPRAGEHSQGFAQATIEAAYACANASDRTYFVYSGDTCEAIPLIAATFAPSCYPVLPLSLFYMRTEIETTPANSGLITPVKCPRIHITFLSFHIVSSDANFAPGGGETCRSASGGPIYVTMWCAYKLVKWQSDTAMSATKALLQ